MISLLHQSIAAAADSNADACAFRCGDAQISYGRLESESSRLANFLIEQGVKPVDRIGVFMPRCVETIVAVYGILKAGCIFVPLDPNLTAGGVETLVKDCGIRHLLTHPKKSRVLNRLAERKTQVDCFIGIDELAGCDSIKAYPWNAFASSSETTPALNISPDTPAYIMYSSGSTGRPKGITHTHYSGLSYSRLSIETYDVTSDDVIANHSPISFDMSTFGYFTSCVAGATTVLIPEAHTKFPSSLAKLIEQERITIWYSVPLALIQLLLRTKLDSFDMTSIRWVKFGGEPFPPKYLKALMQTWPRARFSNVYGPAEVNQCTYFHLPTEYANENNNHPIPIGRIWNETLGLILDHDDNVVTNGSVGELLINSPTMMQGYWSQPEKNKDAFWRFVDDQGIQRVFYKTGDVVRRDDADNLIFLGRKDRQVKIRGYRVELDEIENAISGLEEIEEVGVFCVTIENAKEIRAAAILKSHLEINEDQIKTKLSEVLSPYAIPTEINLVNQLPRTNSGKINRIQLTQEAEGLGKQ